MTSQKSVFLASEGDAWFRRNEAALQARDWAGDPLCRMIADLDLQGPKRVLEIGCGEGLRLQYLASRHGFGVSGLEPSQEAVAKAAQRGVDAHRGTADRLPFADATFDIVMFGFCLYLCDDSDLFRIGAEADRVLRDPGWLLILDFDSRSPVYRTYHHASGIRSRKMEYKSLFEWHPAYTLASYRKFHHATVQWTDDVDEWVSACCLRKSLTK